MTIGEKIEVMQARVIDAIKGAFADKSATQAAEAKEPQAKSAEEDAAKIDAAEAENERLRKQLAAQREEKAKAEADAFVMQQLRVGKLLPAEADATKADYLQAVEDDAARPLGDGSRVSRLCARIESRPSHKLTEELTVGPGDKVLKADENTQTEMSEERRKELLGKTPAGKAALSIVK
jgi:hypothetical protein